MMLGFLKSVHARRFVVLSNIRAVASNGSSLRRLSNDRSIQVAIVGSGPAGFYTADRLLKHVAKIHIDLFEMQPVPFGLVRYGVAPDHPEVKQVIHKFQSVAQDPRCMFIGNVKIGENLSIENLRSNYHAVVLAYGAEHDKHLHIEGENLQNVMSARSLVGWYNGLPAYRQLSPDMSCKNVVVIGHGNVALDVTRLLLTSVNELKQTDMTHYAIERLSQSNITKVYIVGRRGPLQMSFTTAELREMVQLPHCRPMLDIAEVRQQIARTKTLIEEHRQKKRLVTLLEEAAQKSETMTMGTTKEWHLKFLRAPHRILPDNTGNKVGGIQLEIMSLAGEGDSAQPMGTGCYETIECGMILRSIGYKSHPIEGIPFDSQLGVVPNLQGRVVTLDGHALPGIYTSGWLKRGPVGVIASTMYDAFETADSIVQDISHQAYFSEERAGITGIRKIFNANNTLHVSYKDWLKIDAAEKHRGELRGKPREKIVVISEILDIVRGGGTT